MVTSRTRIWMVATVLFVIVSILGLCAHFLGWYQDYWYADVILHTLSGVMFALFWFAFSYNEQFKSKSIFLLIPVMAGIVGSYLWELWEFGGAYILPGIAIAYVPNLGDSLSDIACGMAGAIIVSVAYWLNRGT